MISNNGGTMRYKYLLIAILLGVSLALVNAQFSSRFSEEFQDSAVGRAFMQTYGALKSGYLEEVDDDVVIQGAIGGMLEALEDPYTAYVPPSEAAKDNQDRTGSFEGIGAVLSARNRTEDKIVEIVNVYRDGPAWQAGIQRGDIFYEVDGENVEDSTVSEVVEKVRGPKDTVVSLGMRRPGMEEILYFDIVRDKINIISVESTLLPNDVGYVRIVTFANQLVHEQLIEQINELMDQEINSLILDLRDNGGGLLTQGILVADEFLGEGDIVFQRARGITQRLAAADSEAFELPMVVLVNNNSASASEIVAGALQDNGRALVIGEETFGKGVGQSVISLANGGQLQYLSFEWLTPKRNNINQQGIVPDILAEDTRFSNVIALQGLGAEPGQEIEFVVAGEVIGKATADEEGEFRFIQLTPRAVEYSDVQGQAIVSLENDNALQVAHSTLLNRFNQIEQAQQ